MTGPARSDVARAIARRVGQLQRGIVTRWECAQALHRDLDELRRALRNGLALEELDEAAATMVLALDPTPSLAGALDAVARPLAAPGGGDVEPCAPWYVDTAERVQPVIARWFPSVTLDAADLGVLDRFITSVGRFSYRADPLTGVVAVGERTATTTLLRGPILVCAHTPSDLREAVATVTCQGEPVEEAERLRWRRSSAAALRAELQRWDDWLRYHPTFCRIDERWLLLLADGSDPDELDPAGLPGLAEVWSGCAVCVDPGRSEDERIDTANQLVALIDRWELP